MTTRRDAATMVVSLLLVIAADGDTRQGVQTKH